MSESGDRSLPFDLLLIISRRMGQEIEFTYPITDAMWESELAFSDDGNMLAAYKDRHQL